MSHTITEEVSVERQCCNRNEGDLSLIGVCPAVNVRKERWSSMYLCKHCQAIWVDEKPLRQIKSGLQIVSVNPLERDDDLPSGYPREGEQDEQG